jgi:hypothetical protein
MKRFLGALAIIGAFAIGPAQAQVSSDSLGLGQVTATCLSPAASNADCQGAVQLYLAAVASTTGLTPEQRDDLLAAMVVALGSDASSLSDALRARIAAVIRVAAAAFTDPDRQQLVLAAAADVESGIDVSAPAISASPA